MPRRAAALLMGLTAGTALAACAGPQAGSGAGADTLNMYLYQAPKLFSPLEPINGPDQIVMSMIFDSLLGLDASAHPQPHLAAAAPAVSGQGTTFTFTLRAGLTWSDGKPFTSADVVYTYDTLANPASGDAISGDFAQVVGDAAVKAGTATTLAGVTAPNPTTVVVTTSTPDLSVLSTIGTLPILPQHVLGSVPPAQLAGNPFFTDPTVGLGPYEFVAYKTDQYVQLRANPHFRSKVGIPNVYLKILASGAVATAQLQSGELDVAQVSPTDLGTVAKMGDVSVRTATGTGFVRIALNQKDPRFADPRVRQAFLYAIDRKSIVDTQLAGKGTVPDSSFIGLPGLTGLDTYAYDPGRARQLLAQAGWDASKPVKLEWVPGTPDRDAAATIVQSDLKAVGVTVTLQQVQASQLIAYYGGDFDAAMFGGGDYVTDPWSTDSILACDQVYPTGGNVPRFCDPALDAALTAANSAPSTAAATPLYQQAARTENQQAAYLWLYDPDGVYGVSNRVQGARISGNVNGPFIDIQDWHLSG